MGSGARVTDEVNFYQRRGDLRQTVRVLRDREPERLRWRSAVSTVTRMAAQLRGLNRMRLEEPVRELVLDLDDRILRRETVLDARRSGLDLDRGEILPVRSRWDLRRTAFLTGVDHELLGRYLKLPTDFDDAIDTAGVTVIARQIARVYKNRADKLIRSVDEVGAPADEKRHVLQHARYERDLARRWAVLSKTIIQGSV